MPSELGKIHATKSNFRSGLDRNMSRLFLLVVSLATSAIVMASSSVMSVAKMLSKHKFTAHSKEFTVSNIATGGFPADPVYGVMQFFENPNDCTGHVQSASYLLDTCMASTTSSVRYSCSDGEARKTKFSDLLCGTVVEEEILNMGDCTNGMQVINCGTSDPNALGDGSYTALSYNQNMAAGTCSNPLSVVGIVNNYCSDNGDGTSVKFDWPTYYYYTDAGDCTGPSEQFPMDLLGCQPETDDDDGDDADDDDNAVSYGSYGSFSYIKIGGDDSSDSDSLSAGAIAGIVIGGVAFLALVAGLSWFFCCRASTPLTKRENEMGNSAA